MTKRSGKLSRKKMKLQHYGILNKQIFILGQKKKKKKKDTPQPPTVATRPVLLLLLFSC